ncbi:MAG: hypothetical protein LBL67_03785 [Coriobacteriales bacterium]|jgi:hypothetical protein|nr:hypothetical protein [Coriobacteriales bacterium]
MAKLTDFVETLISEVGVAPGGSLAEQKVAELCEDALQSSGLPTQAQEFTACLRDDFSPLLLFLLSTLACVLAFFGILPSPILFILALLAVLLLVLGYFNIDPLTHVSANAASQNVIARYVPEGVSPSSRVVLVAQMDSTRAKAFAKVGSSKAFRQLRLAACVAVVLAFVLTFLNILPLGGPFAMAVSLLCLLDGLFLLFNLIVTLKDAFTGYAPGAAYNYSSLAALTGVAERLAAGGGYARTPADLSVPLAPAPEESPVSGAQAAPVSGHDKIRPGLPLQPEIGSTPTSTPYRKDRSTDTAGTSLSAVLPKPRERAVRSAQIPLANSAATALPASAGAVATVSDQSAEVTGQLPLGQISARERIAFLRERGKAKQTDSASISEQTAAEAEDDLPMAKPAQEQLPDGAHIKVRPPISEQLRFTEMTLEKARQEGLVQDQPTKVTPSWFATGLAKAKHNEELHPGRPAPDLDQIRSRLATAEAFVEPTPPAAESDTASEPEPDSRPLNPLRPASEQGLFEALPRSASALSDAAMTPSSNPALKIGAPASIAAPLGATQAIPAIDLSGLADTELEALGAPGAPKASAGLDQASGASLTAATRADNPILDNSQAIAAVMMQDEALPLDQENPLNNTQSIPTIPDFDNLARAERESEGPATSETPAGQDTAATAGAPVPALAANTSSLKAAPRPGMTSDDQDEASNQTGSFAPLAATGIIKAVSPDDLAADRGSDQIMPDMIIADAAPVEARGHDSAGAAAHSGMLNMPEQRHGLFARFGHKKREQAADQADPWADLADVREEGKQIGSWDNFNDEDDSWQGGAFGGSEQQNQQALRSASRALLDKEVWLVALGSSNNHQSGMRKLIEQFPEEMKRSKVVNLASLGAGDLSVTTVEGFPHAYSTDKRLQRTLSAAGEASDQRIAACALQTVETPATEALRHSIRALSLIGLEDGFPAGYGRSDDLPVRLDDEQLERACDLLVEALKSL